MGIHSSGGAWIEFYSDLMVKFHEQYAIARFTGLRRLEHGSSD